MGEAKRRANVAVRDAIEALAVDTVGGRVQVRWNTHRAATPFGQLALTQVSRRLNEWKYIAEQLKTASVWQRVCEFIATAVTGFNWLAPRKSRQLMHCATG